MGMSNFVKKMMFAHQLEFEEGKFEMLGVRGILLPDFTVTHLIEAVYGEVGEEAFDILFEVGDAHGRNAIEEVGKKHKMSKNEFMRKMVESGNVMGVGKMSLTEFNPGEETAVVLLENSPFVDQFRESDVLNDVDRPVDDFVRGVLHGIFAEVFEDDDITAEERRCAFQGGDSCEFLLRSGGS